MELTHILVTAVNAIFPIVLVILLGYWLKVIGFLPESFIKIGSKLGFRVLLPAMLFLNVYKIEDVGMIPWDLILFMVLMLLGLFLASAATVSWITKDPRQKGVIVQAAFRSNTAIIGVPLATALGGTEAVAIASIMTAFTIPMLNILGVVALSMFLGGAGAKKPGPGAMLKSIARNPLINGILLGAVCLALRAAQVSLFGCTVFTLKEDLSFLYTAISQVGSLASPFALLVLGGQFSFSASGKLLRQIVGGTFWRIILGPVLGIGLAFLLTRAGLLHCRPIDYPGLIAVFGTPVAVSSAIMAAEMGSDEQLATQLVVWTNIGSILSIFAIVCILMSAGLLIV